MSLGTERRKGLTHFLGNKVEDGRLIRPDLGAKQIQELRNLQGNPKSWAKHYQTTDGYDAVLHFENDRLLRVAFCRAGENMADVYADIPVEGWTEVMEAGLANAVFEGMRSADKVTDYADVVGLIIEGKVRDWAWEHTHVVAQE